MIISITILASVFVAMAYLVGLYFGTTSNTAQTKVINNKDRKFGSAPTYRLVKLDGRWCMFSDHAIERAVDTAEKNKEDILL